VTDNVNGCDDPISNTISVTVNAVPSIDVAAVVPVCIGGSAVLVSTVTNGTGLFSYQWQSAPAAGGPWASISGATNASYTASTAVSGTTFYRVILTDAGSGCGSQTSVARSVTVYDNATVSINPDFDEVCIGGVLNIIATVSSGSGTFQYSWESSPTGDVGSWTVISGAITNTFSVPTASVHTTFYRVSVLDNAVNCDDPVSAAVEVSVINDPLVTIDLEEASICEGGSAVFNSSVSGGIGTASYQWQYNDPVNGWTDVPFATSATFGIVLDDVGSYAYRVVVLMSQGCNRTSASLTVVVNADPTISITSNESEVCLGAFVNLNAAVTGGSVRVTYHGQSSPNGRTGWTDVGTSNTD
jgi:hypothetical protein